MEEIGNELKQLLIKIFIPALVAISVKIAIDSRKRTISRFNVVASVVTGLGMSYLFSGLILSNFSSDWVPLMVGGVAISGEKLGNWLINRFNLDAFIEMLIEKYYRK